MKSARTILLACCVLSIQLAVAQVETGADLLFEKHVWLIEGRNVGLVTNHSAFLSSGKHLADALAEDKRTKLLELFGPEHGVRGEAPADAGVQSSIDTKTSVPAYSLYGAVNKQSDGMLKGVDVLILDLQDVGFRDEQRHPSQFDN